jgi:hypothetical protein
MKLDKHFIRNLEIPFSKVMPHGGLKQLQALLDISMHTPRQVLAGTWTNEEIVKAALKTVTDQRDFLDRFLAQFPREAPAQNGQSLHLQKPLQTGD